jgi:microcystin-dependent protein
MAQRNYSNTAPPVALTVAVNTTATTLTVASTTGYPSAPFLLGIERGTSNEEVVYCTGTTSTTFTVVRGYDGTSGKSHNLGSIVEHTVAALDYREANTHVNTPHDIGNALPIPNNPTGSSPGDTAYTGTDTAPARADHRHARESFGSPVASAPGDTGSAGTSNATSRADHRHERESIATTRDNVLPAGIMVDFAGLSAPDGWLLCNGQAVSRSTYSRLYNAISTIYGAGNGSTTFNIPDFRGRVAIGLDNMGGTPADRVTATAADNLGGTGGTENVTLTINQIPVHSHGVNDPGHTHSPVNITDAFRFVIASPFNENHFVGADESIAGMPPAPANNVQVTFTPLYNALTGITIQSTGSGAAHPNMQPYMALTKIIKV